MLFCSGLVLVEFLGSFKCRIIPSANRDDLTSSFSPAVLSFPSLVGLTNTPSITINRNNEERGFHHLVPDFSGNFNFSSFSIVLGIDLPCADFIMLRFISSILCLLR